MKARKQRNVVNLRPNKLEHLERDKGYRWNERDPELDELCREISDTGWSLAYLEYRSTVRAQTIHKWLNGDTQNPHNSTMRLVADAIGLERRYMPKRLEFRDAVDPDLSQKRTIAISDEDRRNRRLELHQRIQKMLETQSNNKKRKQRP